MKILLINWQDRKNPLSGGAEIHIHEIFGRIAKCGHEITFLCSSFKGAEKREIVDGMEVLRIGRRSNFNFYVPFATHTLLKNNYDIVIDNINKIPFFTPLYVKKVPILAIGYHFFGRIIYYETNPLFASYVYFTEKLVPKIYKTEVFSVISESTKNDLKGVPDNNIHIISPAIAPEYMPAMDKKSTTPLIVYVGRIKKYKCLDLLLHSMKTIISEVPNVRLDIVGTGDYITYLVKLSDELKLNNYVNFVGFVTEQQKIEILQSAWMLVNPSAKEGWGITNIEANACGTPVVASNSPGLRDSVVNGETGFLVEHGNVNELATTIVKIIRDTKLREILSQNGIAWAKKFSWDSAAHKTIQLMETIIQSKETNTL
ncbi:MAG: glycosyltransferase family 4 protein [Candidatus Stahlbacteria bacterium]|nr:glycosyltransferase family 4 protein [Candidatus Stahlbacteria bacterium]